MNMKPVNSLARDLRLRRGESQQQVAEVCGMRREEVCRFENGQRRLGAGKVLKMAAHFGVNVDALIYDRPDLTGGGYVPIWTEAAEGGRLITGTEYFRRLAGLSQTRLARLAGYTAPVIYRMCSGTNAIERSIKFYMRVAEVLGVTAGQLLQNYDGTQMGDGIVYPSRTECLSNCIATYRRLKSLTLEQLGQRLGGKSRECARVVCASINPCWWHIDALAAFEGISPDEFRILYAPRPRKEGDA